MAVDRSKALKAAQKHLAKGHLDKAIVEYERLVADDPGDARQLLKLGDLYTKNGQLKQAADTYRKVADQYAEQGFFLKAVAVFKQILKLDPTRLDAWEKLAEMYELLSLVSDALSTYEQVADAYARAGNTPRALDAMGKMARLDPDNVANTIKYAEALSRVHRTQQAAEAFMQGADALKRQGRIDDYIKVAERLLFHQPEHLDTAKELAALYLERGDPKHALAKLQTCFKADPRDVGTLRMLASSFELLGQTGKAVSVYRELARVVSDQGDTSAQVAALQRLLSLDPEHAEARRELASLGADADNATTADSVPIIDLSEEELGDEDDDIIVLDDEDSGVVSLTEDDHQSGARNMPASARPAHANTDDRDVQAQIEQMLSECEVFRRYHLHDKMETQLQAILSLAPDHLDARVKLAGHYAETGREAEAAAQFVRAARIPGLDPMSARRYLDMAADLDPKNPAVTEAVLEERPTSQVRNLDALDIPEYRQEDDDEDELIILDDDETDDLVLEESPAAVDHDREVSFADVAAAEVGEGDDDDAELIFEEPVAATDPEAAFFGDDRELDPAPNGPPDDPGADLEAEPELVFEEASEDEVQLIGTVESDVSEASQPPAGGAADWLPPAAGVEAPAATPAEGTPVSEVVARSHAPAAPASAPAPAELPEEVADAIEEADFYLQQGLAEEALESLSDALAANPDHPALLAKLAQIRGEDEDATTGEHDQSFALAETLALEASPDEPSGGAEPEADLDARPAGDAAEGVPVADVIKQFKAGVERAVDKGDAATHYDLGIAYVEMGLHQEAISEFKLCLQDESRRCQANTMIGLSFLAEGTMPQAIAHFQTALACDPSDMERLELLFELGNAHELLGKQTEALGFYQEAAAQDPAYRDVGARVERLQKPKDEDEAFDEMFDNMILKD